MHGHALFYSYFYFLGIPGRAKKELSIWRYEDDSLIVFDRNGLEETPRCVVSEEQMKSDKVNSWNSHAMQVNEWIVRIHNKVHWSPTRRDKENEEQWVEVREFRISESAMILEKTNLEEVTW